MCNWNHGNNLNPIPKCSITGRKNIFLHHSSSSSFLSVSSSDAFHWLLAFISGSVPPIIADWLQRVGQPYCRSAGWEKAAEEQLAQQLQWSPRPPACCSRWARRPRSSKTPRPGGLLRLKKPSGGWRRDCGARAACRPCWCRPSGWGWGQGCRGRRPPPRPPSLGLCRAGRGYGWDWEQSLEEGGGWEPPPSLSSPQPCNPCCRRWWHSSRAGTEMEGGSSRTCKAPQPCKR